MTVVKSESLSEDMATAGREISNQDLRDAGPIGLQDQGAHALHGKAETTGGSVNTVSLVSTDTILPRKLLTPAPRNSRSNTPATVGPQIRPLTPLLHHRPPVPPTASPRRLLQDRNEWPNVDLWTQRVDRILMDAEDRVLLYHGIRIAPSEVAAFCTEAEHISTQFRDCYLHCNPAKQQEMATCQRANGELLIQLTEANHDAELDASIRGSISSGPSGPVPACL